MRGNKWRLEGRRTRRRAGRRKVRVRKKSVAGQVWKRSEAEGSGLQDLRERGVDEGRGGQIDVVIWNCRCAAASRGGKAAAAPGDDYRAGGSGSLRAASELLVLRPADLRCALRLADVALALALVLALPPAGARARVRARLLLGARCSVAGDRAACCRGGVYWLRARVHLFLLQVHIRDCKLIMTMSVVTIYE